MADGGEVTGRNGNDVKKCTPCSRKDTFNEAVNFCIKCETFFCEQCSKQHDELLLNHPVRSVNDEYREVSVDLPTEICSEHTSIITMYCKDHDKIGCPTCMALTHRSCIEVLYIPKAVLDLMSESDVRRLNERLTVSLKKLTGLKIRQDSTVSKVDEDIRGCLADLAEYHEHLQDLLSRGVHAARGMIIQSFEKYRSDKDADRHAVESLIADLKSSKSDLSRQQGNVAQQFIEAKKCERKLLAVDELSASVEENINDFKPINGMVRRKSIKLKKRVQANVSVDDDEQNCDVNAICILEDGNVLLADFNNKKLKILDTTSFTVNEYCPLNVYPTDVCCFGQGRAILASEKGIIFVDLEPNLEILQTLTTSHACVYIAYSHGQIVVSDGCKSLYVYNKHGTKLRSIPNIEGVSQMRHITFNETGTRLYLADIDRGFVTLQRDGTLLNIIRCNYVKGTYAVCTDGIGGAFVCGWDSNNVAHAFRQTVVPLDLGSNSLHSPQSLTFDRESGRCFVSQCNSNNIVIYTFDDIYRSM